MFKIYNKSNQEVSFHLEKDNLDFDSPLSIFCSFLSKYPSLESMDEEQIADFIWQYVSTNTYHFSPVDGYSELHKPGILFRSFGYGFCDDRATALALLARGFGLKARVIWLSQQHVITEIMINNHWQFYDPDIGVKFITKTGQNLSTKELINMFLHGENLPLPISINGYTENEVLSMWSVLSKGDMSIAWQSYSLKDIDVNPIYLDPNEEFSIFASKIEQPNPGMYSDPPPIYAFSKLKSQIKLTDEERQFHVRRTFPMGLLRIKYNFSISSLQKTESTFFCSIKNTEETKLIKGSFKHFVDHWEATLDEQKFFSNRMNLFYDLECTFNVIVSHLHIMREEIMQLSPFWIFDGYGGKTFIYENTGISTQYTIRYVNPSQVNFLSVKTFTNS